MTTRTAFALALAVVVAHPPGCGAQAFPDRVAGFAPGPGASFGQAYYPGNVLGAPHGSSDPETPQISDQHLLSLGDGGHITLEFVSHRIVDGPGPDFTVFENPVQVMEEPGHTFVEAATVSVSEDGTSWTTFPFDFTDPGPPAIPNLYANGIYTGFAGMNPSLSSPDNGISPFDPAVSGGDAFDLADIAVARVRFVRLRDTGTTTTSPTYTPGGTIVNDPGNWLPGVTAGFDLDAVAAIHTEAVTAVRRDWEIYE